MGMTGYINKRLRRTNEMIVYRTHLAWMPVFLRATPFLLLTSVAAGLVSGLTRNASFTLITVGIGALVTLLLSFPRILRNIGTDIVVTDRRLHTKTGIIDVDDDHETPLTNIDDTVVDPTVFGRLLGYGDVFIHTLGSAQDRSNSFTFRGVVDPYELMAVLSETRDALVANGAPTPYGRVQGGQGSWGGRDADGGYGQGHGYDPRDGRRGGTGWGDDPWDSERGDASMGGGHRGGGDRWDDGRRNGGNGWY